MSPAHAQPQQPNPFDPSVPYEEALAHYQHLIETNVLVALRRLKLDAITYNYTKDFKLTYIRELNDLVNILYGAPNP